LAEALRQAPQTTLLYGDEDEIGNDRKRHSPQFKPAWNRELFWCNPAYSSCWVVAAELWNQWLAQASSLPPACGWQGMLLGLLSQLQGNEDCITHVPLVLSHQSCHTSPEALPAGDLQLLLQKELGLQAPKVFDCSTGHGYRLQWPLPATALLSVVIPTRDRPELLQACLKSIERFPAGCDLEIVVADNGSVEPETLVLFERFRSKDRAGQRQIVVSVPGPFNYSRINNVAVEYSKGSVILLLNNDVEFLHEGWGLELASHALRPGIGCVGAQLLYPDHTVQHGGVILGVGGIAGHAHQDFPGDAQGYHGRLHLAQELSAVTGACLAISREHWQELGGLDATHLAVNYNDVDLGLRARQLGLRNLYLPQVRAIHHESKSRGRPEGAAYRQWRQEWAVMERRWGKLLFEDPAYSPHLSLEAADWSLALRPAAPLVR
jgi:GT2 family glycosyltransferase